MNGKNMNLIQNESQTPPWERKIKKQIDDLRTDIEQVQRAQNANTNRRSQKHPQDTEK